MASTGLSRVEHAEIRAQLRTLRARLTQARDLLVHFKEDRIDRDRLEPAARRVDDLMDLFVGDRRDTARGAVWLTEIQNGVDELNNPKAAEALSEARVVITALLKTFGTGADGTAPAEPRPLPGNDQL